MRLLSICLNQARYEQMVCGREPSVGLGGWASQQSPRSKSPSIPSRKFCSATIPPIGSPLSVLKKPMPYNYDELPGVDDLPPQADD